MKNINIIKIRRKLDKVDIKLLQVIKERSVLVDKIVGLKKIKMKLLIKKG